MPEENREAFLRQYLPEDLGDYFDLLTDFRCSGYRILGDLVCDCMDAYRLEDQRKLHNEQDSPAMTAMLDAYLNRASGADYKTAVAQECRKQLESIIKASEAVKYAEAIQSKFDDMWRDKVLQFQTPIFSLSVKGAWTLRFDDILADALELGPLQNYEVTIPKELRQRVEKWAGKKAAPYVCDLIAYYHAHRTEDCDWVVLPVTSFDMYYGGSYFSKSILSTIPEEILERQNHTGTCRYRITDAFRL